MGGGAALREILCFWQRREFSAALRYFLMGGNFTAGKQGVSAQPLARSFRSTELARDIDSYVPPT